jgi:quercetin 2,3-dioxygenase
VSTDANDVLPGGGPAAIVLPKVADVGGIPVQRLLPRSGQRTVGAWCFVDVAGPVDVAEAAMQVGPHPHIGLHAVSWMIHGEVVHRDSLGSEQVLRAGELNLMTAGHGIAHAEQVARETRGVQQMVQLWVAQPEATRHGSPAFAHHDDLPRFGVGASHGTLLVGSLHGEISPVRSDTPLMGAELLVDGVARLRVDRSFEHSVLALDGDVVVAGTRIPAGALGYLPTGRGTIEIAAVEGTTRVMVLGGEPFPDRIRMHWNFVARTNDELAAATADWNATSDRFGAAVGGGLPRIAAPPLRPPSAP